jgi:hypothetical protein
MRAASSEDSDEEGVSFLSFFFPSYLIFGADLPDFYLLPTFWPRPHETTNDTSAYTSFVYMAAAADPSARTLHSSHRTPRAEPSSAAR